jgi:hypothetical protein
VASGYGWAVAELWGIDAMAAMYVPSRAGDERFRRWWPKLLRTGSTAAGSSSPLAGLN